MAIETTEYLGMVARMIRAGGRRVGDADELELSQLIALREELDKAVVAAIDGQRAIGRSWASIAVATGTTRQTAWERYGKRPS